MTKLDCNVTSCMHNADNCCCKSEIIVDGHQAKDCCETCCGSFDENKGCEAVNCVYNEQRHCQAEHIGIAGDGAVEASQTECSSFRAR